MDYYLMYIVVGLLGVAIGSFLNAVIYRLPREKSVRTGRSVCPECGVKLKWYHNVPILSFLLLRGKCAFCGKRISLRYPIVETCNGLAYLYFFWQYGLSMEFAVYSYVISALLIVIFVDLEFRIIPDSVTLPGIVAGLAISFLPQGIGIIQSIIGLLVGGGSLYLVAMLGDWLFKKESMGGGDIKLAAMLGALLGWQKVLFIFMGSAVVGLAVSIPLMIISSRLRRHRTVPFGPFISVAAVAAIVYGDQIIKFYIDTFIISG
ncbi:MAG: prepilin peptidase [Candidatus Zixiibacteriota bacterium]|nr:MAG: prepilin peptidase [candidate division Zixibacteria bacterium]